jgi:hypothetical protein
MVDPMVDRPSDTRKRKLAALLILDCLKVLLLFKIEKRKFPVFFPVTRELYRVERSGSYGRGRGLSPNSLIQNVCTAPRAAIASGLRPC